MTDSTLTFDTDAVSLGVLVADVEAVERDVALAQIRQLRVLARAGRYAASQALDADERVRAHDMALRSVSAELGGVMRVTDRTVQRRIDEARVIVEGYPAAVDAWEAGRITRGHVMVIVDAGSIVPVEHRAAFEAEAIARCQRDTPNRVRAELEILAQRMHPETFASRHERAASGRCVRVVPGRDGMSDMVATVPTVIAAAVHDRLTQQAHAVIDTRGERAAAARAHDLTEHADVIDTDARGIDAVRADIFADLLLAGAPSLDDTAATGAGPLGAIRARVQILVAAGTLTGDDDGPADLVGHGIIDPCTTRSLAGSVLLWERLFCDPVTGVVERIDSYRPTLPMRRSLQARDQHCRFPGCRRPAIRCEVDHTVDHALGGPTALSNLGHLCQRHHSMKQFTAWRVRQRPGGVLEWTSPAGRTYREDAPTPSVAFRPAAVDPPGAPHQLPPF